MAVVAARGASNLSDNDLESAGTTTTMHARLLTTLTRSLVDDQAVDEVIARHMLTPAPSPHGVDGMSETNATPWWKQKLNSWEGHEDFTKGIGQYENEQSLPQNFTPKPAVNVTDGNGRHLSDASPDRFCLSTPGQCSAFHTARTSTEPEHSAWH